MLPAVQNLMKKHKYLNIISTKDTNMKSVLFAQISQNRNEPANAQGEIKVTWPSTT